MKFLQIPTASSYTANGIITNTRAVYKMKSLQKLAALSNFKKSMITDPLAVLQSQLSEVSANSKKIHY